MPDESNDSNSARTTSSQIAVNRVLDCDRVVFAVVVRHDDLARAILHRATER